MPSQHIIKPVVFSNHAIASAPVEGFPDPSGGTVTWKTLLSASKTPSNTFTVGIARCNPNGGHLKLHRHKQAEIYHVTEGTGVVTIDGVDHAVEKGSVVFIPGNAEHGIRNTNGEDDLVWLYAFATDSFEDVVYCFKEEGDLKAKL